MNESGEQQQQSNIYESYRNILHKPELLESEIDEMRQNVILLAEAICNHIWDT